MPLCSRTLAAISVFAAIPAAAQPIATDRPDFTEGTSSVALGRVQVEAGTTLAADLSAETVLGGPEVLLRAGVGRVFGRGVEARVVLPDAAAPVASRLRTDEATFGDAAVGVKAELGRVGGWDAALIADVTLPVGTDGAPPSPRALVALGREVGRVSVGTQAEALWDREADRVLVGATLVGGLGLTERVSAFLEVAASALPEGPAAVVLHSGVTLALGEALQLDVHGGAGVTRTAPDVFVGAGVGVRF